eukprot:1254742-Ditylum_brightwellii.AAC.1
MYKLNNQTRQANKKKQQPEKRRSALARHVTRAQAKLAKQAQEEVDKAEETSVHGSSEEEILDDGAKYDPNNETYCSPIVSPSEVDQAERRTYGLRP